MVHLLLAVVILGTCLNVTGWIGNAIVLKSLWTDAHQISPQGLTPVEPRWLREGLTFVSDYVFAFVVCCLYRAAVPAWSGARIRLAVLVGALTWLAAVPMTYLALVNAGYLPIGVSVATSLWALLTFLVFSPALPKLLPNGGKATHEIPPA